MTLQALIDFADKHQIPHDTIQIVVAPENNLSGKLAATGSSLLFYEDEANASELVIFYPEVGVC